MTKANVVVVGGGAAGLAAAALASKRGARVTLFEAGKRLGGRALTRSEDGFLFNMGAHALYPGAAIDVLRELRVEVAGRVPSVRGGWLLTADEAHRMPTGPLGFLLLSSLSFTERIALGRVFARAARRPSAELAHVSCEQWLCGLTDLPRVRTFARAFFRLSTYVAALDRLDAKTACEQLALALRGVRYVDGGWQTIVDGLALRARQASAEIKLQTPVRGVLTQGDRVRGVVLKDGQLVTADAIVVALAPSQIAELLPEDEESRMLAARTTKVRAACFDVGLRKLPRPEVPFALGLDFPGYLSVHSQAAKLAPDGQALVHVARYLQPDEHPSSEALRAELEMLLERVQPGYREHLVTSQFLPGITVMEGFPEAASGGGQGRAHVAHGTISGLYRAGDWVGSEGLLLDAALASARCAAHLSVCSPAGGRNVQAA
jgi:phytoene dehydrogenase-like protein